MSTLVARFPKCKNCKYYQKGRCRLFFDTRTTTVSYAKVEEVRADKLLCGPKGVYWTHEDYYSDHMWCSDISYW